MTRGAYLPRQVGGISHPDLECREDQIEIAHAAGQCQSFLDRAGSNQIRGRVEIECNELAQESFPQLTIFGKNERVIQARDQKDAPHGPTPKILKTDTPFGNRRVSHTTP